MPDIFPNEAFPADAAIAMLDGVADQSTGLPYIAKGVGPASTPSYEIQYNRRLARQNARLAVITAGLVVDEGNLAIGVYPLDYRLGGVDKRFAGATNQSVSDNQTHYVYVDEANVLQIAASEPADITSFIPLARVDAASGMLTISPRTNLVRFGAPQLAASVAGEGLSYSAGTLAVATDDASIESSSGMLQVKAAGVTPTMLADSIAESIALVDITIGDEGVPGANNRVIGVQLLDARGDALAARGLVRVWLATSDFGAPSASGHSVSLTVGAVINTELADGAYVIATDSSGAVELVVTAAGDATRYIMASTGGRVASSGAVVWSSLV
jgi:hypothetical protein